MDICVVDVLIYFLFQDDFICWNCYIYNVECMFFFTDGEFCYQMRYLSVYTAYLLMFDYGAFVIDRMYIK